jgi:hypothetical protein
MRKYILAILLSVIFIQIAYTQEIGKITWREITQEMKPWTRWWWQGNAVTEKDLTAALEKYKNAGLGGVEITPIYGVRGEEKHFIDFLSPAWMDKLVYTLQEAKRLDLGVDLANASGWPFGGPWINEDTACKYITSKVFQVRGGQTFSDSIYFIQKPILRTQGQMKVNISDIKEPVTANKNLQEYAFDQIRYEKPLPLILVTAYKSGKKGFTESIDLTGKVIDGKLTWTAPEGEWTICALFQGYHGKMVERAGPGGEGNVIDHFSAEALDHYLDKFNKAFKNYDISYLRCYFNDSYEVDDASGESDWTPDFFAAFQQINHYDLRKYIPALLGLDTKEMNSRVIYDYRMTIGELLLKNFTERWHQWAETQGKRIRNQSHGSPANVLDLYAASDIPEIEGEDIVNLKSAPSVAHVTGKKLVSSESATWLNEHFESNWGQVKTALDKFFLAGVNHAFYHGTAYSPQDAAWPGWLFYAAVHFNPSNSLWDDFKTLNQYVARSQSFLQAGKPSNDILLYFNVADYLSDPGKSMLKHFATAIFNPFSLKKCGDYLTENGYSWDAISDKQLQDVSCNKNILFSHGSSYKTILIPETNDMPAETFEKIINLAKEGASVLFIKDLPAGVPGLAGKGEATEKIKKLIKQLSFKQTGNLRIAACGKGKIIVSGEISELVAIAGIQPESFYKQGLQSIRRLKEDGNYYYFIKNTSLTKFTGWITLQANYASAAYYNPMTGVDGYAPSKQEKGKTALFISLQPEESFIIETFKGTYSGQLYPFYEIAGSAVTLTHWDIHFVKGGPMLPESTSTDKLQSWTVYGGEYEDFSGTAEYVTTIPPLQDKPDAWSLRLEKVNESAAVYLNGKYLGTLLNAPYEMEIPGGILQGNDTLKIVVSNLMANRIIYLDKHGIEWRKFYNTNFNAKESENRGEDGKFTAIRWKPKDSGLSGPVTLTPLKKELRIRS